jgi:pullulanase
MYKSTIIVIACFLFMQSTLAQPITHNQPLEKDMWVSYTPQSTIFKLFSPGADSAVVKIYKEAKDIHANLVIPFELKNNGVWVAKYTGNAEKMFYTYQVKHQGKWLSECVDIYANAVTANGKKAQIINWKKEITTPVSNLITNQKTKAIVVYELHVRDATIFSKAKYKGKFLGLTEVGLTNRYNQSIGLDHLKKLGVTHVQLLPIFDFNSIDETSNKPQYNWGYGPLNYNVPEGSYSTNANEPLTRIKECRAMVDVLHKNGIGVIMDVVYNHTALGKESNFELLCPNYYYRRKADGKFSDASGCGNETASDKKMFQKFMIESLTHWVHLYNVDGFRFDLMAIHDIETMNLIAKTLKAIKPNIILYGEGWTAGDSPLPESKRALKKNANKMDGVGVFSDDIRDAIKGSVFNHTENGFIAGIPHLEESIKFGLVGGIQHKDVDYSKVNYSKEPYTNEPFQHVSYNECHDNHTLWDRLVLANPTASKQELVSMYEVAMGIVMTSQGISFMQAGQEFCRTKKGEENSYNKPDEINGINWDRLNEFQRMHLWIKKLIALKKSNEAFCLGTTTLVQQNLQFTKAKNNIIVYEVKDSKNSFVVIINTNKTSQKIVLPNYKNYKLILNNNTVKLHNETEVAGTSFTVLQSL